MSSSIFKPVEDIYNSTIGKGINELGNLVGDVTGANDAKKAQRAQQKALEAQTQEQQRLVEETEAAQAQQAEQNRLAEERLQQETAYALQDAQRETDNTILTSGLGVQEEANIARRGKRILGVEDDDLL